MANGTTDPFYVRFTTPQQENLILGTSRAAQGLQPNVLEKTSNIEFYNYAFTITISPYGETYLNSIKKKVKKGNKPGVFILAVDPWAVSSITLNPNEFRELQGCLNNTPSVDKNPNFTYLIRNLKGDYQNVLTKRSSSSLFLHENGWLEVSVPMDSSIIKKRLNSKIEFYRDDMLPKYSYSPNRFGYLKKTIEFLSNFGNIYLVRLPIAPEMMEIENELMPDFNKRINEVTPLTKGYLDMTAFNEKYIYVDGNHLYKGSGKVVSEEVAKWIISQQ
jgi:hypothetical protein